MVFINMLYVDNFYIFYMNDFLVLKGVKIIMDYYYVINFYEDSYSYILVSN